MNESVCATTTREPWYKNTRFPLIPVLKIKKGNEWNSRGFTFTWLGLMISDAMSPHLDFHFYILSHSLIGFRVGIPYVNIWFHLVPIHYKIGSFIQNWTWRVGAKSKFKWMR